MHLEGKHFDRLFEAHEADWTAMARTARETMTSHVADGSPTLDDVKKILHPMVELDSRVLDHMVAERATGKHWIGAFADYILHRVYNPQLPPEPPAAQ